MNSRLALSLCYLTMAVLLSGVSGAPAKAEPPCQARDLSDVYDLLLPTANDPAVKGASITIRFLPGDTTVQREGKVVLTHLDEGGAADVVTPVGSSVYEQLRTLRQKDPTVCDEINAKSIELAHRTVKNKAVARLLRDFAKLRIPVALDESMYLDADRIEVLIHTPMNSSSFVLYGGGANRRHPLILWARDVLAHTVAGDR